jgi:hypothetical protein
VYLVRFSVKVAATTGCNTATATNDDDDNDVALAPSTYPAPISVLEAPCVDVETFASFLSADDEGPDGGSSSSSSSSS